MFRMSKSHLSCSGCETSKGLIEMLMADLSPEASKPLTGEGGRVGEGMKYVMTREKTEWLNGEELTQPSLHRLKEWSGGKSKRCNSEDKC